MIRRIAGLVGLAALASPAMACPEPADQLLFHSCWGTPRAAIALLPEDLPLPEAGDGRRLTVTGAYTGRSPREEGRPDPVGFFMRAGEVINRNMARMDGLALVFPDSGALEIQDRSDLDLGGRTYDLRGVEDRQAFIEKAGDLGLSVMQSHLLIIEGEPDVTDQAEAPRFRRRMLFTDADGYGVFQSSGAVTLYDAAQQLEAAYAPRMAMNLDMGSYDFCLTAEEGVERRCGVLPRDQTGKLSNLLILTTE